MTQRTSAELAAAVSALLDSPSRGAVTAARVKSVVTDILDSGAIGSDALTEAGRAILNDANAAAQRTTLGLGNVDNTSDANKPVSTATQTALDALELTVAVHSDAAIAAAATATADAATATAASYAAVVAAATAASTGFRQCIYHSPSVSGISHYRADIDSSGVVRLNTILYADGSERDLSAPARGLSENWKRTRPGIYASTAHSEVATYYVGTDDKVWAIGYEDGSMEVIAGAKNPVAEPDTSVAAYIDGGALKVIGDEGVIATVAASGVLAVHEVPTRDGKFKIVSEPAEGGVRVTLADLGVWYENQQARIKGMPGIGNVLYHIIVIGQSLGAGSDGHPNGTTDTLFDHYATAREASVYVLTNSSKTVLDIRGGCYRGNSGSAEKIRENELTGLAAFISAPGLGNVHGMTPIDTFVDFVTDARETFGLAPKFLLSSCALGGVDVERWWATPSSTIDPTIGVDAAETPWTLRSEFDAMVNAGKAAATARGWGYEVALIVPKWGESDYADSGYVTDATQVINEINADITTPSSTCYTGQACKPLWFSSQPCSFTSDVSLSPSSYFGTYSVDGQLTLHDLGLLHCACPDYAVIAGGGYTSPVPDYVHMAATGYAILGAYFWRNFIRKLIGADAINPLRATAVRSGTTITLTYTGGEGQPLVFDTALITERSGTDYGFRWLVGGVPQVITPAITGDREIQITIPSSVGGILGFADFGHVSSFSAATQPRGNVRETVGFASSIPGITTLYDWASCQTWSVA